MTCTAFAIYTITTPDAALILAPFLHTDFFHGAHWLDIYRLYVTVMNQVSHLPPLIYVPYRPHFQTFNAAERFSIRTRTVFAYMCCNYHSWNLNFIRCFNRSLLYRYERITNKDRSKDCSRVKRASRRPDLRIDPA